MRILLDMDGVIVDTLPTWLQEYRHISGDKVQLQDIKQYGFAQFVTKPDLLWKALTVGRVFLKAFPMPDAINALRWLNDHHEVYIVTYSHESVLHGHRDKLDWLKHWAPFIHEDQVVFTKHKWLIDGDVFVEDAPENLVAWLGQEGADEERRGFLIEHIYNKDVKTAALYGCDRVQSLMDVCKALRGGR